MHQTTGCEFLQAVLLKVRSCVLLSAEWALCCTRLIFYTAPVTWQCCNVCLFTVLRKLWRPWLHSGMGAKGCLRELNILSPCLGAAHHFQCVNNTGNATRAIHICKMRERVDFLNPEYPQRIQGRVSTLTHLRFIAQFETATLSRLHHN